MFKKRRTFTIATLADNNRLGEPISILTAGLGLATQLFPNIFGSNRRALTSADWDKLFPGNGYYSVLLKTYLSQRIKYDVDTKFLYPFNHQGINMRGAIADFVVANAAQICPDYTAGAGGTNRACWSDGRNELVCQPCMTIFSKILQQEQYSGGNQPVGQYPGGMFSGTLDMSTILLVGGGLLALVLLSKKSKAKK